MNASKDCFPVNMNVSHLVAAENGFDGPLFVQECLDFRDWSAIDVTFGRPPLVKDVVGKANNPGLYLALFAAADKMRCEIYT